MEVDSKHAQSSIKSPLYSSPFTIKRRMFRSISNFKNIQYFGSSSTDNHHKRVFSSNDKEVNNNNLLNSDHVDDNNLISYEHLSETSSSLELVLPLTIFAITVVAVIFIAFILFVWIRKTFRENNRSRKFVSKKKQKQASKDKIIEQLCSNSASSVGVRSAKRCEKVKSYNKLGNSKMNSRKWLRENSKQIVDNSAVVSDDIEQRKLESVEFKTTPPTSPNSQKELQQDDEEEAAALEPLSSMNDEEQQRHPEIIHEMEKTNPFACPMTISDISVASIVQPSSCDSPPAQSSLSLLQEEVHCIQPKEEKIFKSIATSPPPFSPFVAHYHSLQHKYATTGTQTYFTKAPNSPNSNLLNSQFAVLQTPTTTGMSSNPFILSPSSSDSNKENKEPTKLRNICLNKSISSFKHEGTSSSASSPSSVVSTSPKFISTSPKVNTNILQQQNSPLETSSSSSNRFNFSPKTLSTPPASGSHVATSTGSSPISAATYKIGNYFRFPDIETPPVTMTNSKKHDDHHQQEVPSTLRKTLENLSIESAATASDKESIILKIDEVESPTPEEKSPPCLSRAADMGNNNNNNNNNINNNDYENTLTIRRARLKSISLDSDGARLVEENLTMPVEELVEIASSAYSNKQIKDSESESDVYSAAAAQASCANNNRFNPKNIYNLTINLDYRDSSLDHCSSVSDINMNQRDHQEDDIGAELLEEEICRTPTMKYFQQKKAVSLDSDQNQMQQLNNQGKTHGGCKMASSETYSYYFGTTNAKSSISVPSTPKHLTSNKLKLSTSEDKNGAGSSGHAYGRYSSRKLGSFDENPNDSHKLNVTTSYMQTTTTKANLTASFQTLNVSSSNLKTLPEIMSINDFDQTKPSPIQPRITPVPPQLISSSKSGILQRRGSNQSLTLNLDGSCGNLMRGLSCSNYSLGNIHGSHMNIAAGGSNYNLQAQHHQQLQSQCRLKKNLLQRRGSNTSLTLNIQGSNNNLNRFNSHSSLNITGSTSTALHHQQRKGGLLERRNSNASLTLNIQNRGLSISNCNLRGSECSLSSVNTNQMNEIIMLEQEVEDEATNSGSHQTTKTHQRKFLSSENLHHIRPTAMSIGHGNRQIFKSSDKLTCNQLENIPVISTKPLSPQSTSEDFKIYLANIQFLQSASNVLDEAQLKDLNTLFFKSYKNQAKDPLAVNQKQFNNDDILNSKISGEPSLVSFTRPTESPDPEQRELLVKLHQEFWNLPTNYQEKPMVFGSQSKNRYKTILPNEHSRVILQKEAGAQAEPYINANYIKGHDYSSDCYIATQGPMQNTIYEFWLMVMQNMRKVGNQGCQKIAMLTDFIESQRSKCAIYFPQDLNKCEVFTNTATPSDENFIRDNFDTIVDQNEKLEVNFNYFVVKNEKVVTKNGYTIRKLLLIYGHSQAETHETFNIYHYWFPDWPDHRSPQDIDVLLDLSLDLLDGDCRKDFGCEESGNNEKNPLPIIHCSAGIGRTGCLAAILNGLGQIRANSNSNYGEGTSVDVLGIVCNLRLQRGGMVQNSEQYELIHRSLCLYYQKLSQKVVNF